MEEMVSTNTKWLIERGEERRGEKMLLLILRKNNFDWL